MLIIKTKKGELLVKKQPLEMIFVIMMIVVGDLFMSFPVALMVKMMFDQDDQHDDDQDDKEVGLEADG